MVNQYVFRPRCFRLASLAENVTAQRSVTHLTLPIRNAEFLIPNSAFRRQAVGCLPYVTTLPIK
ncbi:MAG: hypothetical protein LBQ66_04345 [Planctomycetaceae bacterium]|nr:hypothetical protein [Planctomycetaceae bacterium]